LLRRSEGKKQDARMLQMVDKQNGLGNTSDNHSITYLIFRVRQFGRSFLGLFSHYLQFGHFRGQRSSERLIRALCDPPSLGQQPSSYTPLIPSDAPVKSDEDSDKPKSYNVRINVMLLFQEGV
jgi:hypothetical protein